MLLLQYIYILVCFYNKKIITIINIIIIINKYSIFYLVKKLLLNTYKINAINK